LNRLRFRCFASAASLRLLRDIDRLRRSNLDRLRRNLDRLHRLDRRRLHHERLFLSMPRRQHAERHAAPDDHDQPEHHVQSGVRARTTIDGGAVGEPAARESPARSPPSCCRRASTESR